MPVEELVKIQLDGIVQIAKWISQIVLLGAGLSITVAIMRISGFEKFKIGQLEFPLAQFVYVVIGLTGVHAFLTWIFVQRVTAIRLLGDMTTKLAWERVTNSEAFIFYNMKPRIFGSLPWPLPHAYIAQAADTAFWFTLLLAVSLIIAVSLTLHPVDKSTVVDRRRLGRRVSVKTRQLTNVSTFIRIWFDRLTVGCALAGTNWIIGSQWAIAASGLVSPK